MPNPVFLGVAVSELEGQNAFVLLVPGVKQTSDHRGPCKSFGGILCQHGQGQRSGV